MLSTLERAETWQFLVAAQPPGKHNHFRAESCGARSQLWLSPAEWSQPASYFFIGLSGNQRRIIPSLMGNVNTNELLPAKVSCKMQSTLKCSFLLHLLHFYQMIFWHPPLTLVCVHFPSSVLPHHPSGTSSLPLLTPSSMSIHWAPDTTLSTVPCTELTQTFLERLFASWRQVVFFSFLKERSSYLFLEAKEIDTLSLHKVPNIQ